MAAPNIVQVTSITGKTVTQNLANSNATVLLSNAAASDNLIKINSIIVANNSGSELKRISLFLHDSAAGAGASVHIARNVGIASDSTLVITDKASSIYLEEDRSLVVLSSNSAGALDGVDVTCSYEEISD